MTPPPDEVLAHLRAVIRAADGIADATGPDTMAAATIRLTRDATRARLFLAQHGALHAPSPEPAA